MKLSDILKKIGIDLDAEIDEAKQETSEEIGKSNKNKDEVIDESTSDKEEVTKEESKETVEDTKETQEEVKVELKFDDKTGLFDLKGIEDADIKAVLQRANDYTVRTANNVKIEKAFSEKLSGLKIRKGITDEVIKKMINFDDIKVDGDKVIGLDEAFETLQKEQSGLFVQRQQSESTPILEGFNPVENNDSSSALNASLASLAASLGSNN